MPVKTEYTFQPGQGEPGCYELIWGAHAPVSLYNQQKSRTATEWAKHTRVYPDGGTEHTIAPIGQGPGVTENVGRRQPAPLAAARVRDVPEESGRRAARVVRRLARYFEARFMWTFTFPGEGVHEYDRAYRAISTLMHHGPVEWRKTWVCAVPEPHPEGHGFHWHVLVSRRCTKDVLRAVRVWWTNLCYSREYGGYVRPEYRCYVQVHVKRWASGRKAGGYAGKYVAKSIGEGHIPPGRHRYLRAEHLTIPAARIATFSTFRAAVRSMGHPRRWGYMFNGWTIKCPFFYVAIEPPG